MIIRKYGRHPQVFVPDYGEVIGARRSKKDPFVDAVVIRATRQRSGMIKLSVVWLDNEIRTVTPIVAGTRGWVYFDPNDIGMTVRQSV